MNGTKWLRRLALVTVFLLIVASVNAEALQNTGTVLDLFLEPDVKAKPMCPRAF